MRGRFRLSQAGKGPNDPWFRIGTLDVNTSMLVVLVTVGAWIVLAVEGVGGPIMESLALFPWDVTDGEVWRVVTWPLSYPGISFFDVINLFLFWYFGQDLEANLLGRSRFLKMVVWMSIALGVLAVAMYAAIPTFTVVLSGIGLIELMIVLAWIAEWPQRRFLFNVPAWLFGLVIVGISILGYVSRREGWELVHFLVGIGLCALIARHYGMLTEHHFVPHFHRPHRQPRARKPRRQFDSSRPTVVSGPWEPPPVSRDEARMNALLDKIHAEGQASLTDKERAELLELRDRLRRR